MTGTLTPETWRFIREHENDDLRRLALGPKTDSRIDLNAALVQIAGRQAAKVKIPSWHAVKGLLFPEHLPLEQCSSQQTALYKASLFKGKHLTDLTGGLGVDFAFMAANFSKAVYVEQQKELCHIAGNNFPLLGLPNAQIVCGNGIDYLEQMERSTCIFIDPARRNLHGKKTIGISDCHPDVKELSALLTEKAEYVVVKLSPMLDVSQALADMPQTKAIHIVSVDNECKELLMILNNREEGSKATIHCINLKKESQQTFVFDYCKETEAACHYTSVPQRYIYEPNSSILKAGAFKYLSSFFRLCKFHPNSHLYTSEVLVSEFPGRIFEFENLFSFNKKEAQTQLDGISKANITVRNFPATVADIRKKLKLGEGGDVYLFATTLENGNKAIIRCSKVRLF